MEEKVRADRIFDVLRRTYPDAGCALHFTNAYELLVATVLSAQCTDERVNKVTPRLFGRCPSPREMAEIDEWELQDLIRSTGFFRNKAGNLKRACAMIQSEYNGKVPDEMAALLRLPGVARKTANVILGNVFGKAVGVVVDTHVKRLAGRMGLSHEKTPEKIENDLMDLYPRNRWTLLSHLLIVHGRRVCSARAPSCLDCPVEDVCPKSGVAGIGGKTNAAGSRT